MLTDRRWPGHQAVEKTEQRQTASLAAIVIILLLLVGGLFLIQHLQKATRIEDCLMAGRRNCDALVLERN